LRQSPVELTIEANAEADRLSHLSSLTRLRWRSTSANDPERTGAIRTRAKTARQKWRANRASVHVSEGPVISRESCVRNCVFAAGAGNSGCLCHYAHTRPFDARTRIHLDDLREFATVDIHEDDSRYRLPIDRDAQRLAKKLPIESEVILLGSVATRKYVDVLLASFRDRVRFPSEFIGRGDMSRGGLMLRCAMDRQQLSYVAIAGAIVNGKRPPKLAPRRYSNQQR
jgi:hypothetical protein